MKKRYIWYIVILLCLVTLLYPLIAVCSHRFHFDNHPTRYLGSVWQTADGEMVFRIDDDYNGTGPIYGSIETDDGVVDLVFSMTGITTQVSIGLADGWQTPEDPQAFYAFAFAQGTLRGKNTFVLKIVSADRIFEAGQRFVFHKVEEGTGVLFSSFQQ